MLPVVRTSVLIMFSAWMAALTGDAAAQGTREDPISIAVGPWQGGAYRNAKGEVEHCAIFARYPGRPTVVLKLSAKHEFGTAFIHNAWQLSETAVYAIGVAVDSHPLIKVDGHAPTSQQLSAIWPPQHPIFEQIRSGRGLSVNAAGQTYHFSLDGIARALDELRACVAANVAPPRATGMPPAPGHTAGPSGRDPFHAGAQNANAFDVADFGRFMLDEQRLTNYRLVPVPERGAALAWKVDAVTGMIAGDQAAAWSRVHEFAANSVAGDSSRCRGEFASSTKRQQVAGVLVFRAAARCRTQRPGDTFATATIYFPRPGGGVVRVTHIGSEVERVNEADARYIDALRVLLAGR
jgi:hypothetical protein